MWYKLTKKGMFIFEAFMLVQTLALIIAVFFYGYERLLNDFMGSVLLSIVNWGAHLFWVNAIGTIISVILTLFFAINHIFLKKRYFRLCWIILLLILLLPKLFYWVVIFAFMNP